ncbi:hypothetical protein [Niabella hirudinis]|uniref:hypothetical protein n=1 Tax=Niabella hirudinis TaxID=1285929 RepID=UPI003EBD3CAE
MRPLVFITLFVLHHLIAGSQTSNGIVRAYKIALSYGQQSICLTERGGSQYAGTYTAVFYKGNAPSGRGLKRLWNRAAPWSSRKVIKTKNIPPDTVRQVMSQLAAAGIATIKNCQSDSACRSIAFLDGDGVTFYIKTGILERTYFFDEIAPLGGGNREENPIRLQAQQLLTTANRYINLKQHHRSSVNQLSGRRFYYLAGNGYVYFKRKKRKYAY